MTPPPRVAGTTTSGSFAGVSVAMSIAVSEEATAAVVFVPSAKMTVSALPSSMT